MAGTQFARVTSTKVQILTPEAQSGCAVRLWRRAARQHNGPQYKRTHTTSTKVPILTPEEPIAGFGDAPLDSMTVPSTKLLLVHKYKY
jgi:hypothetical protein